MPILPVLDLMQGQIVRGVGGRRAEYRPVQSKLTPSSEPQVVAAALRERFGFTEFYLADLDAIEHGFPDLEIHRKLQAAGHRLWIDGGLRRADDPTTAAILGLQDATIVVGLETIEGPDQLQAILERAGPDRTVFSVDLKNGQPLGRIDLWQTSDPWQIAIRALDEGVRRLVVLDLANVGCGAGVGTEHFCPRLRRAYPAVQLTTGGGVRGMDDVRRLETLGADFVLVASALHDGRIPSLSKHA